MRSTDIAGRFGLKAGCERSDSSICGDRFVRGQQTPIIPRALTGDLILTGLHRHRANREAPAGFMTTLQSPRGTRQLFARPALRSRAIHVIVLAKGSESAASTRVSSSRSRTSDEPHIGKYKLLKTIGKGNFAKVKLAKHMPTGKEVSVFTIQYCSPLPRIFPLCFTLTLEKYIGILLLFV
uniref:Protein kinase domain-containing protein n=1 Tax=Timema shepardi TaxID=629360 RepID=A0A7R9ATS9_TIMSH|nr:unnamed protein product [Timema shepardi]